MVKTFLKKFILVPQIFKQTHMKKNYFLTLFLTLCFSVLSFGQVIITELADPNNDAGARYVEIYNLGNSSVDLTNWSLKRYTNASPSISTNVVDLTPIGSLASGAFAIIAANATNFQAVYGMAADINAGTGGPADSNGDDQIVLFDASDTLVDIFGVPGEDGTGTCHEFEDGRAERKGSVSAGNTTWAESEWNVWADSTVSGCTSHTNSPRTSPTDFDPKAWIGTATTPTLTINSPSAGSIPNTTSIDVSITIANFTVSGDNGSGASDGTGDGYIKSIFETQGGATDTTNFFSSTLPALTVAPGNTYTLTLELLDNAGVSLNPVVSKSVTFTVEYPCDLTLGDSTTTCDAITSGSDTFSGTIAFTGGNTGTTYTITAPAGVTVGGDNPDTVSSGTITFTGMTEGTDAEINFVGGANSSCDITRTLFSPICKPFPIVENFDYTENTDLIAAADWSDASTSSTPNNIQVVTGTITNPYTSTEFPDPSGNMVTLSGGGSDPFIAFNESSEIFTSFLFSVNDMTTVTNSNGGYFVVLAEPSGSFRARLWLKPNDTDATKFNIGLSSGSSASNYTTTSYAASDQIFVVMSYSTTDNEINLWVNPAASTFEATSGTPDITIDGATASVGRFLLRQDSSSETPSVNFDELRIGSNWASVTPKGETASGNIVTPLTSATWSGFINTFSIADGSYQFGFSYPVDQMKTTITSSSVTLQPNFAIWTAEASNAAWFDNSSGSQTPVLNIEGNSFVENNDLAGEDLTFSGNISVDDLDAAYTVLAFIKALDPNNGFATVVNKTFEINATGDFSIAATAAELATGYIIQYGFSVTGPPADPANESALGSVVIGDQATASLKQNSIEGFNAYPNPITNKRFTVSTSNNVKKFIKIYNILGKQVFSDSFTGTTKNIDIAAIGAGVYILKVTEDGKTATKKLVIR